MPYDSDADDDDLDAEGSGRRRRFVEFDCPECNANNPYDEGFGDGDEVLCNYCGQELVAAVSEGGKLKLKPT